MSEPARLVRCPLCGARFAPDSGCRPGCLLAERCLAVCCPRCHYSFVERSPLADLLRRVLGGSKP